MAVLLLILKIIGIILLILLGLILLILAVVLFVPVRYQVSGSIGEKTTVRIAVTWLLHVVHLKDCISILHKSFYNKKALTFFIFKPMVDCILYDWLKYKLYQRDI